MVGIRGAGGFPEEDRTMGLVYPLPEVPADPVIIDIVKMNIQLPADPGQEGHLPEFLRAGHQVPTIQIHVQFTRQATAGPGHLMAADPVRPRDCGDTILLTRKEGLILAVVLRGLRIAGGLPIPAEVLQVFRVAGNLPTPVVAPQGLRAVGALPIPAAILQGLQEAENLPIPVGVLLDLLVAVALHLGEGQVVDHLDPVKVLPEEEEEDNLLFS